MKGINLLTSYVRKLNQNNSLELNKKIIMKKYKLIFTCLFLLCINSVVFAQKINNEQVETVERPIWAGFYTNKTSELINTKAFPFIKGMADRIKWSDLEPQKGVYDWSKMDEKIHNAVKGKYYYYFVLWTGPHSPEWIYDHGVPKVACKGGNRSAKDVFPFYLDKNYINFFYKFIGKLAEHIASLPKENREAFSFIQPAFGSTGDKQLYKGTPINPEFKISAQQYLEFCSGATKRFYEAFDMPELKHIKFLFNVDDEGDANEFVKSKNEQKLGEQLYANWLRKNYQIDLRKQQFTIAIGYQANDEIKQDNQLRPTFYGLNGKKPEFVRGEFSKFGEGEIFKENKIWNYYWTAISTVDRGLDLWEVDYNTVKTGLYNEGFEFSSKYSYYKKPQSSPYAFIAFRDVLDAADTARFNVSTYGEAKQINKERVLKIESEFKKYGAKVGDLNAATTLKGQNYLFEAKSMNDVGFGLIARNYSRFITQIDANQTSVGLWRVGPTNQPYGRYARSFENESSKNRMYFDLDDLFLSKKERESVSIKIIYLDEGNGKFSFRYDGESNSDKIGMIIAKTNSGKWVEKTITIKDGAFANKGLKNSDFSLVNEDIEDDIFHMIEITKNL
jgi:hypothetical protein